jgi:hypothetical protein
MMNEKQEEKKHEKKSKSQFRSKRPPLPANRPLVANNEENLKRIENIRSKRVEKVYNTDTESLKRQSKIPRLSMASVDRIPKPKKFESKNEYVQNTDQLQPQAKAVVRRSQSFLQNKITPTNKDVAGDIKLGKRVAGSAAKPGVSNNISRRSANYKPYTLREYKEKVMQEEPFSYKTRGGLGANIGGEEWMKEHEKRLRIKEFSNRIKNTQFIRSDGMRNNFAPQYGQQKEK